MDKEDREDPGGMPDEGRNMRSPSFRLLVAISFVVATYNIGMNNGIVLYGGRVGMTATESGLLVSVFMIAASAMRLIGGGINDRIESKPLLIAGTLCTCIGCFILLLCQEYPFLIAARIVQAIGYSVVTTTTVVMVAEMVPATRLGEGFGYRGLGVAFSNAVGPLMAMWLVGFDNALAMFLGFGCVLVIALVLEMFCKMPGAGTQSRLNDGSITESSATNRSGLQQAKPSCSRFRNLLNYFFEASLLPIMTVELFRRVMTGACTAFMVLYGASSGFAQPGLFFVFYSTTIVLFRLFGRKLFDYPFARRFLVALCAIGAVGFTLLYAFPCTQVFYLAGVLFGIVEGLGSPYLNAMSFRQCPESRWGVASANFHLTGDMGAALGALVCGWCVDAAGYDIVPAVPAITLLMAMAVSLGCFRNSPCDS